MADLTVNSIKISIWLLGYSCNLMYFKSCDLLTCFSTLEPCNLAITTSSRLNLWVGLGPARVSVCIYTALQAAELGSKECAWKSNSRNKSCSLLSGLRADVTASLNKGQGITGWFGGCLSTHTTHSHFAQCSAKMTGKVQKLKTTFKINCKMIGLMFQLFKVFLQEWGLN